MKYLALISASISCLTLSACATVADGQTQDVTIRTPGAENARCYLENQDFKYVAYSDETIEIMKSPHDMTVRCQAPGNRNKTVEVARLINEKTNWNIANGYVPGAAYDYFSRGAFGYPAEVVVSFVGEPVRPYDLPKHQADDLDNLNHKHEYEAFGPSEVVTEANRYDQGSILNKRFRGNSANYESARTVDVPSVTGTYYDPTEEDK